MHTNSICTGTGHDLCILLHAGSPVYVAPEVLQKKYGQKADVWSAGMVAYLLLCARLPWKGDQSITTSDLYVSMGDGKTFNRKVLLMLIQGISHVFPKGRPHIALLTFLSQVTGHIYCLPSSPSIHADKHNQTGGQLSRHPACSSISCK